MDRKKFYAERKFYCERLRRSDISVRVCVRRQESATPGSDCYDCPQGQQVPRRRRRAGPGSPRAAAEDFNRLAKGRWHLDPDHLFWVPRMRFSWRAGVGQALRLLRVEGTGNASPELVTPLGEALGLLLLRPNVGDDPEWRPDTEAARAHEEAWCVESGARLARVRSALLEAREVAREMVEADSPIAPGPVLAQVEAALSAVDEKEKYYREAILAKSAAQPRTRGGSAKQRPGRPVPAMRRALVKTARDLSALGLPAPAILRALQSVGLADLSESSDFVRQLLR